MTCTAVTPLPVKFVISVEVPCGFVVDSGATLLNKALYIDTHCTSCINERVAQVVSIEGLGECNITVNRTVLVGALHYDMVLGGFFRAENGNPSTPITTGAQLTKTQSMCLHSIPVALNCEDCPAEADQCSYTPDDFRFTPEFGRIVLYTNNYPEGIVYADDQAGFMAALKNVTPTDAEPNANGCKTIVFAGQINITLAP